VNKQPWMMFFTGDWIKGTRRLKSVAKALWIDLLAFMWENEPRGELYDTTDHLAIMTGLDYLVFASTVDELAQRGFLTKLNICPQCDPGPFEHTHLVRSAYATCTHCVTPQIRIVSRRMSREEYARAEKRKDAEKRRASERLRQQKLREKTWSSSDRVRSKKVDPYISESYIRSHKKKEKEEEGKEETNTKALLAQNAKPDHVQFVDSFKQTYESLSGQPFATTKLDFITSKRLIDTHGLENVIAKTKILGAACQDRSLWFTKESGWGAFNIGTLSRHWNSLLADSKPDPEELRKQEFFKELKKAEEARERFNATR
jgi:hypothetical protein